MLAKKMRTNDEMSPGKMASERRRSKVRIDKLQSQIEELAGVLKDFRTAHLRAAARASMGPVLFTPDDSIQLRRTSNSNEKSRIHTVGYHKQKSPTGFNQSGVNQFSLTISTSASGFPIGDR